MKTSFRILNERVLAMKIAHAKRGDYPYTIFIGAGASQSCGIPTVKGMVRQWQEDLYQSNKSIRTKPTDEEFNQWLKTDYKDLLREIEQSESEYGALFSYFHQEQKERQNYIEQLIEGKKPTFGYMYLAGLIAEKRFNRILTTNFDDLLSDALFRFYDIRPIVCAFDSAVAGIRVSSDKPKIIKLHGDFLYDNIKNVRHELKRLDTNMEEKLYQMCKDAGLIVVGYGGEDESIMAPLSHMITKDDYLNIGLHWCVLAPVKEKSIEIPPKLQGLIENYGDRIHIYAIQNFDSLMEEMFVRCKCKLPEVLVDPHHRNLAIEFNEALQDGKIENLSPTMVDHLSIFMDAAATQTVNNELVFNQAEVEMKKGINAFDKKQYAYARACYEKGYNLINNLLKIEIKPFLLLVRAWKRKTGLCAGLADVDRVEGKETWRQYIAETLQAVEKGKELCQTENGKDLPLNLVRTFYENGISAYGIKAKIEDLSDEEIRNLHSYLDQFKMHDPDGMGYRVLIEDPDVEKILHLLE